ncbi:hypothetical protein A6R68_21338, partial [Neotoma lepida]
MVEKESSPNDLKEPCRKSHISADMSGNPFFVPAFLYVNIQGPVLDLLFKR